MQSFNVIVVPSLFVALFCVCYEIFFFRMLSFSFFFLFLRILIHINRLFVLHKVLCLILPVFVQFVTRFYLSMANLFFFCQWRRALRRFNVQTTFPGSLNNFKTNFMLLYCRMGCRHIQC